MKINKGISVLLVSILMSGMLVGCSNNSNSDTTKALTKTVKEVTKDDTEVEVTKNKEKEFPPQDNNKSTPKDTNQKETTLTKEDKKEEPKQEGYYITCPNGHKVWTVNGDYDCQQCYDDYMNQKDDKTDECSICGGHVGGKEMCECDGTIHHRSCHVDAYSCPSCNRYGLNLDPDIYGCPYCGYPNEEHQESSDVEEYNDEVDIIDDTDEDINY